MKQNQKRDFVIFVSGLFPKHLINPPTYVVGKANYKAVHLQNTWNSIFPILRIFCCRDVHSLCEHSNTRINLVAQRIATLQPQC